jgi:signal transduction histidine kinase
MSPSNLISPEALVPRLGEQLVKMGLLSEAQLKQALEFQLKCAGEGQNRLLGQAIVEMGFLDRPTLDQAVTDQILSLRAALEDINRNLELRVQQRTMELEEALRRLSEINQLKANFVANVSHELRTPLTHVRGYLDLLYSEALGGLNAEQKKAVDVSLRSSLRLQSLIDDLILFSQTSRGEMTLTITGVDLGTVIKNVLDRIQPQVENHQLVLELNIAQALPPVQADQEKVGWVIAQLLDNAVKFSKPGGKVSLTVARNGENNSLVDITVADSGIGIPKDRLSEIFEPFHQLDGSPTRRYGGTGLGLALVLQIIEAHGSVIEISSEINKGTTVSFPLLITKDE